MKRPLLIAFTLLLAAAAALGWQAAPERPGAADAAEAGTAFGTVAIYLDSGDEPLAAYQIELSAKGGGATIVGIEGGEGVFTQPPYYDPEAIQNDRAILAAFSTADDGELPRGRVRVATVHVMTTAGRPVWDTEVTAAAGPGGAAVETELTLEERGW